MKKRAIDPKNMNGPQKAAIFLLSLGEERSSEVFKRMSEDEIMRVATRMAEIEQIPPEALNEVMEEFVSNFEDQTRLLVKGDAFIKSVIEKTTDRAKAESIFQEIEDRKYELPFVWSRDVDVSTLISHLEGEHPQTIAMIMARRNLVGDHDGPAGGSKRRHCHSNRPSGEGSGRDDPGRG